MLPANLPFQEFLREIIEIAGVWKSRPASELLLIPVMLDDCPVHERLERFQCVTLSEETRWERLLGQIRHDMRQSPIPRGSKIRVHLDSPQRTRVS